MNTISRSLSAGPGAVQLVDADVGALKVPMFGFAVHWSAQRVGYGVGVCGRARQGDGAVGVHDVGRCGHAGDDGRDVLVVVEGDCEARSVSLYTRRNVTH